MSVIRRVAMNEPAIEFAGDFPEVEIDVKEIILDDVDLLMCCCGCEDENE
jgi:hypothetical protein